MVILSYEMLQKYFKLELKCNDIEEIFKALDERGLYSSDLLYRVFAIQENVASTVKKILRRGTDRLSDKILGNIHDGIFNVFAREDVRLKERGRPLKPSEYVWLAKEKNLEYELCNSEPTGTVFVSVYDPSKMIAFTEGTADAYEFADKENPQDALIALIELEYH